jgi:hypothetical protein
MLASLHSFGKLEATREKGRGTVKGSNYSLKLGGKLISILLEHKYWRGFKPPYTGV